MNYKRKGRGSVHFTSQASRKMFSKRRYCFTSHQVVQWIWNSRKWYQASDSLHPLFKPSKYLFP